MNEEIFLIILLADTELPEDHVEDVLNIDPAEQPSQRVGGHSQILGGQFFTLTQHHDTAPERLSRLSQ